MTVKILKVVGCCDAMRDQEYIFPQALRDDATGEVTFSLVDDGPDPEVGTTLTDVRFCPWCGKRFRAAAEETAEVPDITEGVTRHFRLEVGDDLWADCLDDREMAQLAADHELDLKGCGLSSFSVKLISGYMTTVMVGSREAIVSAYERVWVGNGFGRPLASVEPLIQEVRS